MSYKTSGQSLSNPSLPPRNSRQTGIPSISGPRTPKSGGVIEPRSTKDAATGIATRGALRSLQNSAYHLLSKTTNVSDSNASSRRRFATMPSQPSPSNTGSRMDLSYNKSRRAASPPIFDFTTFEDTYRGPRMGNFEGLMPGRQTGRTMRSGSGSIAKPIHRSTGPLVYDEKSTGPALPASARKPDPRLILSSLESILDTSASVDEYLNAHDLLAMHQLDQVDFEDRDRLRSMMIQHGKSNAPRKAGVRSVLGEPIRKASIYASTSMVLAGRQHELPIIVVNTVEELYRTGIYQPNLFRTLPNRTRLLELIDIYDSEGQSPGSRQMLNHPSVPNLGFGSNTSLRLESTPDVCALLTTYLSALPEPILTPVLFRPIWDWCGLDDEATTAMQRQDSFGPRISHIPMARTYTSPTESTHILIAQLLLQLLPSPNFSLLIYLLAFFSQAALVCEENGVGVSDLSRMFGERIFGGDSNAEQLGNESSANTAINTSQTKRTGETMMSWFLRRWGPLSEGLFDVVDDAKMGIFHRPVARRDSFGKDILASWIPGDKGKAKKSNTSPIFTEMNYLRTDEKPSGSENEFDYSPKTPVPRIQLEGAPIQSTPRSSFATRDIAPDSSSVSGDTSDGDCESNSMLDDTLDITQIQPSRPDNISISSTTALDERLMDISLPALLKQTLPTLPISRATSDNTTYQVQTPPTPTFMSRETQTLATNPTELMHALNLTAHLEEQLEERTNSLTNALKELTKSKLKASQLQLRVEELEAELAEQEAPGLSQALQIESNQKFEQQLEVRTRERNDAQTIVSEIKKLVKN